MASLVSARPAADHELNTWTSTNTVSTTASVTRGTATSVVVRPSARVASVVWRGRQTRRL